MDEKIGEFSQSLFSISKLSVFHLISHLRCQLPLKGKPQGSAIFTVSR